MTENAEIVLTFLGDMMCLPEQISSIASAGASYDDIFSSVKGLWGGSEYVLANLETPVAPKTCRLASGSMTFNAPLSFLNAIKSAGIDCVSLANNHCLDCGLPGLDETIANVRGAGLDFVGAYSQRELSDGFLTREINGVPISILACTYGINGYDMDGLPSDCAWRVDALARGSIDGCPVTHKLLKRLYARCIPNVVKRIRRAIQSELSGVPSIEPIVDSIPPEQIGRAIDLPLEDRFHDKIVKAKTAGGLVIAYPHIGGQYNAAPGKYQRYVMDWMAKAGADIVVANHAHRPLGSCILKDKTLGAYALGNFCFTPRVGYYLYNVFADYSIILHVHVSKTTHKVERCTFNVVKSVTRPDGVSVVKSVVELYGASKSERVREALRADNEVLVHMLAGELSEVDVLPEYEIPLPWKRTS